MVVLLISGVGIASAGSPTPAATGDATAQAGVEEPGDESLPGGGHADDPNDANTDQVLESN